MQHREATSSSNGTAFAIVFAVVVAAFVVLAVSATSANAQQGGACQNPQEVLTIGPTTDNVREPFEVTGNTFRVSYDVTFENPQEFPALEIDIEDRFGLVDFATIDESGSDSFIVTEGPGSFELVVNVRPQNGATYTVSVEDCGGTGGGGNGNGGSGTDGGTDTPADRQYNTDGKEVTVIVDTIPDKKVLVDTGGPTLPMIGGLFLALGLVGLGIFLLGRT